MNKINYLWLATLPLAFVSCEKHNESLKENPKEKTVLAIAKGHQTRGQVEYGKDAFMWNTGDELNAFPVNTFTKYVFKIDKAYDETNPSKNAYFTYTNDLQDGELFAFYPYAILMADENITWQYVYEFSMPGSNQIQTQSGKNNNSDLAHLKEFIFMHAKATVKDGTIQDGLHFEQLNCLFRYRMTNNRTSDVYVKNVKIELDDKSVTFVNRYSMDPSGSLSYKDNRANIKLDFKGPYSEEGALIAPGETYEGYAVAFPHGGKRPSFTQAYVITLTFAEQGGGEKQTIKKVPVSEIAAQNNNVYGFERGKRYGFNISIDEDPKYIEINGKKVSYGPLVADGENGAKIGLPSDEGLYFQFGSLIGWSSTGSPTIAVKPADYAGSTTWNSAWQGDPNTENPTTGTGDPCKYYLKKGNWRLLTKQDYDAVLFNANYPKGPWFASGTFAAGSESYAVHNISGLKYRATGQRDGNSGTILYYGANGYAWTSTPALKEGNGNSLIFSYNLLGVYDVVTRATGTPIRCILE